MAYRQLNTEFWQDPEMLDDFSPEDKYFYLWLLTNPKARQCGIFQISKREAEIQLGYTWESVEKLILRFENQYKKIMYSPETKEIAVKNWLKWNPPANPSVEMNVKKDLATVKNRALVAFVLGPTPSIQGVDTVGTPAPIQEQEQEQEQECQDSLALAEEGMVSVPTPSESDSTAQYLYDSIKIKSDPPCWKHKSPDLKKWSEDIEKLHRIDKIDYADIRAVIDWSTSHAFWSANILSADKLRKQFNKLYLQMRQRASPQRKGFNPNDAKQQEALSRILAEV